VGHVVAVEVEVVAVDFGFGSVVVACTPQVLWNSELGDSRK